MRGVKLLLVVLMMVLALAGLVLTFTACSPTTGGGGVNDDNNGIGPVTFVLGGVVPEGTATVAVSVTGAGIAAPITGEFHLIGDEWQWVVANNPTVFGEARTFTVSSKDAGGTTLATSTATIDVPEALTRVVI